MTKDGRTSDGLQSSSAPGDGPTSADVLSAPAGSSPMAAHAPSAREGGGASGQGGHGAQGGLTALCLAALGVVYGDIGTSPLYSLRECFHGEYGLTTNATNIMGLLSLVFWSLTIIVSLKYLHYVMRADDEGEGGILALMALAAKPRGVAKAGVVVAMGLFGAGLLVGDGVITPAISVLSAIEGLELVTSELTRFVVPITVAVLVGLFTVQRRGTEKVGRVFGPIIVIWFVAIGGLGLREVVAHPWILTAVDPRNAIHFFLVNKKVAFLALGSVFLVVTGGEALYADMGHFGLRPIRITWYALVLPALLLNYFGQGAIMLRSKEAAEFPFYALAPKWALLPMVVLSTAATIIASQAVISGVYSVTRQASMLGYWPRIRIAHTSARLMGQIYVPSVNWAMMVATILVVLGFRSSSALAAAYGIAVTSTMVITTLLASLVARHLWKWPLPLALLVTLGLVSVDLAFLGANLVKIARGGWLPLSVAAWTFLLMISWHYGRARLGQRIRENLVPLQDFHELMRIELPKRVPGTAVFMASNRDGTPPALVSNFMHNHVVHDHVVLLTVQTTATARVHTADRMTVEHLDNGFVRLVARFGFMETPDVPSLLEDARIPGVSLEHTTYFLGRDAITTEGVLRTGNLLAAIKLRLYTLLSRNAASAYDFFNIPADRVMEIGSKIRL